MMNQSVTETAVSRALIEWALSRPLLVAETPTGIVFRVEQADGRPAALKIFKGEAEEERRGTALLAWYGGEGAARVLADDADAALLEWIDGQPLSALALSGRDDEAAEIIADVVRQLHAPRYTQPVAVLPLRERFDALLTSRADLWPETARDLYGRARGIALSLFDRPAPQRPLHGDLHHDNVLQSDRGWLVIDPKGLVGDPVYEVANAFLNPWSARDMVIDQSRIGRLADCFADRLGFDRKRILGFAAAHAALSTCWDIADGRPIGHQLATLPNLLAMWELA